MLNVVLVEPEIPPNTGNIIRLAANSGCRLHLLKPLGFALDDKRLRRAGLDYDEWASLSVYDNWRQFMAQHNPQRLFAISTKGRQGYTEVAYQADDYLVFGPETRGLSGAILGDPRVTSILRIPMQAHSRSMNLANAVAVIVYEAWRQLGFANAV